MIGSQLGLAVVYRIVNVAVIRLNTSKIVNNSIFGADSVLQMKLDEVPPWDTRS